LTELTINSNEAANDIAVLTVEGDGGNESLATLNVNAAENVDVATYATRAGTTDPEAEPEDSFFTLNVDGAGDTAFTNLDQGADITRMSLNNAGEGDLTVSELDIGNGVDVRLDGAGAITLSDVNNTDTDEAVIIRALGEGDRTVTDISNDTDADDIRIRGDNDLTIGADGGEVALADTTVLDASTFTGDLTAFVARTGAADTGEANTIQLGSGDDTISLTVGADGQDDKDVTFVFDSDSIGDDTIVNFMASTDDAANAANEIDELDFSAFADGTLDYTVTDGVGTLADGASDFEVTFTAGDADGDGNEDDLVATSDGFEGSVSLIGVAAGDLADANFAGT
jgi:hypothetical protein